VLAGLLVAGAAVARPTARQGPASLATLPATADRARAASLLRALQQGLDHVPGEVLVKFRDGTDVRTQAAVMALAPASATGRRLRWVGDVAVLGIDDAAAAGAVADRLAREPEVEYAQPNWLRRLDATPNDPGLSRQWNFTAIDMPRAWDINPGAGADVVVAVVDSGVTSATLDVGYQLWTGNRFDIVTVPYRTSPDLDAARFAGAFDTTSTRLFITNVAAQPVLDTEGHGTHVASTIVETTNNNLGFAGIAHGARLLSVKSCFSYWDFQFFLSAIGEQGFVDPEFGGGCVTSDVVAGIRLAADSGATVINLSLGGEGTSPAERDAIAYAVQRGAFVAIAMGNGFEDGNPVEYPAAYAPQFDGVMSVGAVAPSLRRAFYSSTGSHLEITAPGGDGREAGNNGAVFQISLFGPDFDPATVIVPRFDRYGDTPSQGTSMATPHVAGLAALLHSQGITSPAAIEAAIRRFARDLGDTGTDPQFGAGLIDARATLRGLGVAR
jgi:serine protease